MSTLVLAVHGAMGDVLAQGNPTPEAPPSSDKQLPLMRYLTWFVVLVVPILVIAGVVVAGLVIRGEKEPVGCVDSATGCRGTAAGGAARAGVMDTASPVSRTRPAAACSWAP